MKIRPILFSPAMVRANLREAEKPGTGKSQTRRVLTRLSRFGAITEFGPSDTRGYDWHFRDKGMRWHDLRHAALLKVLPFQIGDRLWVRETWTAQMTHGWTIADARSGMCEQKIIYRADKHESIDGWWSSIHMPREFSRITLTVTDVRVQRLQDISWDDAVAEGLIRLPVTARFVVEKGDQYFGAANHHPTTVYAALWDRINARRGFTWHTNPWVVALTYTVERRNVDAPRFTTIPSSSKGAPHVNHA